MKNEQEKSEIIDYTFNGEAVHFELFGENIMVNATEMGKIFGKNPKDFLRNETTIAFINECLKKANSPFLNVENEEDLFTSKQKSGTWMHRVLALEFASWLSPAFKLWVWITIDHILFGHFKKMEADLKASAKRRHQLKGVMERLLANPDFLEFQQLQIEERQSAYLRGKMTRYQRDLFEELMFNS